MGTVVSSGTHTVAVLDTVETLGTAAGPGTFQLVTDVAALALADVATFYIDRPALAGGTSRTAYVAPLRGGTEAACEISPPIDIPVGVTATFKVRQTGVAPAPIPWAIEKIA